MQRRQLAAPCGRWRCNKNPTDHLQPPPFQLLVTDGGSPPSQLYPKAVLAWPLLQNHKTVVAKKKGCFQQNQNTVVAKFRQVPANQKKVVAKNVAGSSKKELPKVCNSGSPPSRHSFISAVLSIDAVVPFASSCWLQQIVFFVPANCARRSSK